MCVCFVTVYLVYVDCMLGTHPPRERESASSVENEIKVIDRLPVASLVDTTPPRPTSVSHLSLQYFLLMDWGDVGGMRFLVFYQLNDTFPFDFFFPFIYSFYPIARERGGALSLAIRFDVICGKNGEHKYQIDDVDALAKSTRLFVH